ncbi:hypothetical protein LINGRAPRIM_LOCUS3196 [Linum grandiflorum]
MRCYVFRLCSSQHYRCSGIPSMVLVLYGENLVAVLYQGSLV